MCLHACDTILCFCVQQIHCCDVYVKYHVVCGCRVLYICCVYTYSCVGVCVSVCTHVYLYVHRCIDLVWEYTYLNRVHVLYLVFICKCMMAWYYVYTVSYYMCHCFILLKFDLLIYCMYICTIYYVYICYHVIFASTSLRYIWYIFVFILCYIIVYLINKQFSDNIFRNKLQLFLLFDFENNLNCFQTHRLKTTSEHTLFLF